MIAHCPVVAVANPLDVVARAICVHGPRHSGRGCTRTCASCVNDAHAVLDALNATYGEATRADGSIAIPVPIKQEA